MGRNYLEVSAIVSTAPLLAQLSLIEEILQFVDLRGQRSDFFRKFINLCITFGQFVVKLAAEALTWVVY